MTIFCFRDNLYRDTAPVPFSDFIYRDYFPSIYKTCTAIAPARNKNCTIPDSYREAKSTPTSRSARRGTADLSCHRDYFPAKVPGPYRWTSGNRSPLQAGSSIKLPTGQFLYGRPSLLPGR